MNRTAQMIKQRPMKWEQGLLTMARAQGGQEAVDKEADRIAAYHAKKKELFDSMGGKDVFEKTRIFKEIDDAHKALFCSLPEVG